MTCPDLLTAVRDLHTAIVVLTDELRAHRLAEQVGIETVVELHRQPIHHEAEVSKP